MTATILLYGATGYSGGLIAAHAAARWRGDARYRLVLAGRDGTEVARLAREHRVGFRVFGLDRRRDVERNLRDVDVLVNAAGPFAFTGQRLVKAALAQPQPPHYVDINGEIDVYKRLDNFALTAQQRRMALVCGAGGATTARRMSPGGVHKPEEVRYLSQHFVERLCSSAGLAKELRTAMEQVVFDTTDP
jgi:short subunit dehydrogenase-like uncharacterized protein